MFHRVGLTLINSSSSAKISTIRIFQLTFSSRANYLIFYGENSEKEQKTEIDKQTHQLFPTAIDGEVQEPPGFWHL